MATTYDFSELYGSSGDRGLEPVFYEIAESMEYRFWLSYRKGSVKGSDWFKDGSKYKFQNVEQLYVACCQWLVWMEQHPLYAEKQFAYQGEITIHAEPRPRILTKHSLLLFLKTSVVDWEAWAKRGDEWYRLRDEVETWIYLNKFEGVNAGFYNQGVVSADLGLTIRYAAELSGANGGPIETRSTEPLSRDALKEELIRRGLPQDFLDSFVGEEGE